MCVTFLSLVKCVCVAFVAIAGRRYTYTVCTYTVPCVLTGYGRKSAHARMQPPTLSLEDSDAAASAAHAPYTRLCAAEAAEA